MYRQLDQLSRSYLSIGLIPVVAFVLVLAVAGAIIGFAFPSWNATALLETPGVAVPVDPKDKEVQRTDAETAVKMQYVTLAEFRKTISSYSSQAAMSEFLHETGKGGRAAAALSDAAGSTAFWDGVATPVLPFSRRDAREYGELKDAASNALVGLDLVVGSDDAGLAAEMLGTVAAYLTNALIRERIRAWVLKNRAEVSARQQAVRADIIEARMRIDTMGGRIHDLKAILARYPEANKLDARQVVNITEGSDRFLSPLAQLVAAETSITQLKESISRKERQALQADLQQRFFDEAERLLRETPLVAKLIPALVSLASGKLEGANRDAEWAREVTYRLQADIAGFSSALASFGIRNEAKVAGAASRNPKRLALLGAAAAILLLGLVAFVRASMAASARAPAA
jgi:hypothetical protein